MGPAMCLENPAGLKFDSRVGLPSQIITSGDQAYDVNESSFFRMGTILNCISCAAHVKEPAAV